MPLKEELKKKIPALERQPVTVINGIDLTKNASDTHYDLNARRKQRDTSFINDYESMADNNILKRALDSAARAEYEDKQAMVDKYNAAKERQIADVLSNYTPQSDETIPMLTGVNANEILHPFKYEAAQKEIKPYLEANNITLDQLEDYYRTQALREQNKQSEQYAKEHPILGWLGARTSNVTSNLNNLVQGASDYITGRPIGSNMALNEYGKLSGNIAESQMNEIKKNANSELGGNLGAGAYQVASGLGDMGLELALSGFNPSALKFLMSANAAGGSLADQTGKNTTAAQKIGTASAVGVASYLLNRLPVDNLFKIAKTPGGKNIIENLIKVGLGIGSQSLEEGIQGGLEELTDSVIDYIINKGESDYEKSVAAYMANGMDEQNARNNARIDVAENVARSTLFEGVAGGVMGGISSANGILKGNNRIENGNLNTEIAENTQIPALKSEIQQNTSEIPQTEQGIPNIADIADRARRLENPEFVRTESQPETIADRVRSVESETPLKTRAQYIGENPFVPGDMSLDDIIESNANKNTPNIQAAQEQLAKPYNKSTVDGMKEYSSGMKDFINMFGNDEVKKSYYPQLVSLLNEYQQTGDPAKYNEAADLAAFIDKQMVGKTYKNKAGNSYDFIPDSFYDEFASGYDAFNKMYLDKKNAIPSLKNETSNYDDALWERDLANATNEVAGQQEIPSIAKIQNLWKNGKKMSKEQEMQGWRDVADQIKKEYPDAEVMTFDIKPNKSNKSNKKSAKKNAVMAEDIGLTYKEPTIRETKNGSIILEADVEEPKQNGNGATNNTQKVKNNDKVSRFATNTLTRSELMQDPEFQEELQRQIAQGNFNKKDGVLSEATSKERARQMIANDKQGTIDKIQNGNHIDGVMLDAAMMLADDKIRKAQTTDGDFSDAMLLLRNTQSKLTDAARAVQANAKYTRTASDAIMKTFRVINDFSDKYFNSNTKNKSKRENCAKIAKALERIGYDYSNYYKESKPKSFEQIKQGIKNEFEKETSSVNAKVFDKFTDADYDFLANLVEKNASADMIKQSLEQKIVTGQFNFSDADIAEVNRLYDEMRKYDYESKTAVDLERKAAKILAKYLPDKSFMDKWNAFRYMSMLMGPSTHVRNGIGNLSMNILRGTSNTIGAVLENIIIGNNPDTPIKQRTRSVIPNPELIKNSWKDADNVYRSLTEGGNGRYNIENSIQGEQNVFNNKIAEGLRRGVSGALEAEDTFFLKLKYSTSLAGYLKANGKDSSIFNSNNAADQKLLKQAREHAINEAKIATFHAESGFNNAFKAATNVMKNSDSLAANAVGIFADSYVPFAKTPANIMYEGLVDYNPAQILHGAYDVIKNGDNPIKYINEISTGMTGSMIAILGAYLVHKGILRTTGKKSEEELDQMTGEQNFSLNFGDDSYTIDWVAPFSLPLVLGGELYNQLVNNENFDPASVLMAMADPAMEMTMLQGIKNAVENISSYKKEGSKVGKLLLNGAYDYVSQGIPTPITKLAKTIDDTKRSSYTGLDGAYDDIAKNSKKIANRIPGLSLLSQPSLNEWGEEQKTSPGDFMGRLAYNMFSPFKYSNTSKTDTEKELYRLNSEKEKGNVSSENTNFIPSVADKTYNGQKLTPKKYTEVAKNQGQNVSKMYDDARTNEKYQKMDAQSQAELLNDIKLFSNNLSKSQSFDDYNIEDSNTYKKKYQAYEYDGTNGLINFIEISNAISEKVKADDRKSANNEDKFSVIDSMEGLTEKDKIFYLKQRIDYSEKAKYLDSINEKYAYDWYMLNTKYGTKKDDINYGLLKSDLPEEEKAELKKVVDMKSDDVKYYLMKNGIK